MRQPGSAFRAAHRGVLRQTGCSLTGQSICAHAGVGAGGWSDMGTHPAAAAALIMTAMPMLPFPERRGFGFFLDWCLRMIFPSLSAS